MKHDYGDIARTNAKLSLDVGEHQNHDSLHANAVGYEVWLHGGQCKYYGHEYASPFTNLQAAHEKWHYLRTSGALNVQSVSADGLELNRGLHQRPEAPPVQILPSSDIAESPTGQGDRGLQSDTSGAELQSETD